MQYRLDHAKTLLARTPEVLRALLADVPDEWTTSPYGPGTWSAHEVVAHLIHCEEADWVPRARIILQHGPARPFDPLDRAGHAELSRAHTTAALIDLFAHARRASLTALAQMALSEPDLDRPGTHPAFGPVTLRELMATWVVHDLNHIAQVCKAMAFQYGDQVGPWRAYLSILAPPAPR
ncbi:MAG: DinB family protein [Phycisphaeraceae bacterium]|nr:DinB family protein [Phycisphaeraceae bacterium]